MVDVPHHIINPPAIQHNVKVEGGTNWDLSRSAVPTPIEQLPDPQPIRVVESDYVPVDQVLPSYTAADGIPKSAPSVFGFASGSSTLPKGIQSKIKSLNKKVAYVVVGHAGEGEASVSKLAWARANNVAALLRKTGHKVTAVKAFGLTKPASRLAPQNRRVEIYAAGGIK